MSDAPALDGPTAQGWRRLSRWSVLHFAARSIVENVRAALFGGGVGTLGLARSNLADYAWTVPIGILAFVLLRAVVAYLTCFYRLHADVVEVRRGLLFKTLTNVPFARVQNIGIEHPFYFRPLGLVTLKIDGAGSAGEEVSLAALRPPRGGVAACPHRREATPTRRGGGSGARRLPLRPIVERSSSLGPWAIWWSTGSRTTART